MIVDTSALLAVYFEEPNGSWVLAQMKNATGRLRMSTVNLTESLLRISDLAGGKADVLRSRLLRSEIEFVAPDVAQSVIAAEARKRYPLNLGDCFAYALAKSLRVPLLTLDRDFRSADIEVLLPTYPSSDG